VVAHLSALRQQLHADCVAHGLIGAETVDGCECPADHWLDIRNDECVPCMDGASAPGMVFCIHYVSGSTDDMVAV
jgi:hypothetical protein